MSQKFAIHRSHLPKHKLLSSYPIMSDSKGNAVESGSVRHGQQAFEALPNNTHRNWWQDEGYVVQIWRIVCPTQLTASQTALAHLFPTDRIRGYDQFRIRQFPDER